MATVVGNDGIEGLPSLQSICDLFRSLINDDTFAVGGQIATDTAAFMKPFLNSAVRDLFSDLRIVSDMRVIRESIVSGIPALPSANAAVQATLTFQGYYNGSTWNSLYTLPPDLMWLMKVWERTSGSNSAFFPVPIADAGLAGVFQGSGIGQYEVRGQNELWFNGALQATDLRLRYMATFPDIVGDNIDFSATYIPIQDCTNAVAQKMVANYCQRLSPDQFALADSRAEKYTKKLISESVLNSQTKQFERRPFGS